jgi:uncharacterized damage-inducible protein DinB
MGRLENRRGRRYDLAPVPGIGNEAVAYAGAILDEARERCIDLVADMTDEALWTRPKGTPFSAGDLVVHMNWAEYEWLTKIGTHTLSEDTVAIIRRGTLSNLYNADSWLVPAAQLVDLCREVREGVLIPCLSSAPQLDYVVIPASGGKKGPKTVRQILMHVTASWVYHSGQVGLLTMQNGLDYQWAFA